MFILLLHELPKDKGALLIFVAHEFIWPYVVPIVRVAIRGRLVHHKYLDFISKDTG